MSFLAEVRRRRLLLILTMTAVVGWIVLELVAFFASWGAVPEIAYRVALVWYVGALAVALVSGWYHGEPGAQRLTTTEAAFLGGLGVGVVVLTGGTVQDHLDRVRVEDARSRSGAPDLRRVAVLYFDHRGGADDEEARALADALTEALIDHLTDLPYLQVVGPNGVLPFRGARVPLDSVGAALGAGTLVHGSLESVEPRARVVLRLVDGASGIEIDRKQFARARADWGGTLDDLAHETSTMLRPLLGEHPPHPPHVPGTRSPDALRLLQRGELARKAYAADPGDTEAALRGDSLLAGAQDADPDWAEPRLLRGRLALERARRADDADRAALVEAGLAHVTGALDGAPDDARAFALRGALLHLAATGGARPGATTDVERLSDARADLERAVDLDPGLAEAQALLSRIYATPGRADLPGVAVAGRAAYRSDPYLPGASALLERLFYANLDLGQFSQARRWCREGRRRFPRDRRFTLCGLWLLTTPGSRHSADSAWALRGRYLELVPGEERPGASVRSEILVAGALARLDRDEQAGPAMEDSARNVLLRGRTRARALEGEGRQTLPLEAFVWLLLDEKNDAVDGLAAYAADDPAFEADLDARWRWSDLRLHPRREAIARAAGGR